MEANETTAEQLSALLGAMEPENANRLTLQIVLNRSGEMDAVAKDVRKFIRTLRGVVGDDVPVEIHAVLNPHGHLIDQRTGVHSDTKIGFHTTVGTDGTP